MDFTPDGSDTELAEATEQDIRVISIIWKNEDGTSGRPVVEVSGMSDWEAASMLRTAARRYQRELDDQLDCPALDVEEEEDVDPED